MDIASPFEGAISWLQSGDANGPRVILVHGTPGSAEGWLDYVLDPPPGTQVLALDRPGFGRSAPERAFPGLRDQAAAVAALLARDGRPNVLVGHSLGGPIVARVALDHPGLVSALVLLAPAMDPALETVHPMQRLASWSPVRAALPGAIRNANAELMSLKAELVALGGELPRIRARVFVVHGTADTLVPYANVAYLQSLLTGAACLRVASLEGRNHFLPWNSPGDVRGAIGRALEAPC